MALSHSAADRLLTAGRRANAVDDHRPASLLGLEQEYIVRAAGDRIDFRQLLPKLTLAGAAVDPGDRYAQRLASGLVVTADAREAEIAIPPLRRGPGYARQIETRAALGRSILRRALPDGHELEGYSTHYSVSMPAALNDEVCLLYAQHFAAAAILLR